ncbi:hypothetical protein SAMN02982922_1015 [Mesorhizobium australicum]|uniref:Sel1 repeat family protein n=2 Tax=Mesorhizobium australicum TaxID=536018 RepID=A0A1X7MZ42_9HYPH|nr:hypothetical protein SAMN02982922_1015 [Mesorhizobium australicum]
MRTTGSRDKLLAVNERLGAGWFFLVLAANALMPVAAPAQETSVLELVDECDILAAHPDDPERYADGVADDAIVPKLAVMACEAAIEQGAVPRYIFQLGRALLAGNKRSEAFAQFNKAADAGYAAASAYLGDAYQFGYGTEIDPAMALAAYQKAVAGGFEIAKVQIDQLQFNPQMYTGEFLPAFFNSDFASINGKSKDEGVGPLARNYVFNLVQTVMNECGEVLSPASVPKLFRYRYPSGWTAQADENVAVAIQTSVAEYDGQAFLKRHGCEGAVAKHVFSRMNAFFSEQ